MGEPGLCPNWSPRAQRCDPKRGAPESGDPARVRRQIVPVMGPKNMVARGAPLPHDTVEYRVSKYGDAILPECYAFTSAMHLLST